MVAPKHPGPEGKDARSESLYTKMLGSYLDYEEFYDSESVILGVIGSLKKRLPTNHDH